MTNSYNFSVGKPEGNYSGDLGAVGG